MRLIGKAAVAACVFALSAGVISLSADQSGSGATMAKPTAGQAGQMEPREFINQMAIASQAEVQLGKLAAERGASEDVKSYGQMMIKDHTQANQELTKIAKGMNIEVPTQLDQKHRDLADRLSKLKGAEFDREYMTAMVQGHEEVLSRLKSFAGNQQTSSDARAGSAGTTTAGGTTGGGTTAGGPTAGGTTGGRSGSTGTGTGAGAGTTGTGGGAGARGSDATRAGGAAGGDRDLAQWATKTMPVVQKHLERARELQQKTK